MDYGRALKYPFADPSWVTKVLATASLCLSSVKSKSLKTKLFTVIKDKATTDLQKWALVSSTTVEFLLAPSNLSLIEEKLENRSAWGGFLFILCILGVISK